jgi:hypothetical protein
MSRLRFVLLLSASVAAWMFFAAISIAQTTAPTDPEAVFNVESKIYHRASCTWARRCTKNCIVIGLSEAKNRGGRACKVCGGPPTSAQSVQTVMKLEDRSTDTARSLARPLERLDVW